MLTPKPEKDLDRKPKLTDSAFADFDDFDFSTPSNLPANLSPNLSPNSYSSAIDEIESVSFPIRSVPEARNPLVTEIAVETGLISGRFILPVQAPAGWKVTTISATENQSGWNPEGVAYIGNALCF